MAKRDTRFTVTIKLRPGKDDDIIAWWSQQQKGDHATPGRQDAAKDALRAGIGLPPPPPPPNPLEGLIEQVQAVIAESTPSTDPEQVQRLIDQRVAQWQQRIENDLAAYIARVVSEQVQGIASAPPPPPVEPAPQVSEEQLERRANKLKKTTW